MNMMETTLVDVALLSQAPWNYKAEPDADLLARFAKSMEHGITPIHVATCLESPEISEVCDGNHRLAYIKEAFPEATKIPVFNHGVCTLAERQQIAVRYNAQWFTELAIPLAECLKHIDTDIPDAVLSLPYSEPEWDRAIAALNVDLSPPPSDEEDWDDKPTESPTVRKEKSVKTIVCPECGATFNG